MAAPAPKPTALRAFDGNRRADKVNDHEPRPEVGMPDCPPSLVGEARLQWDDLGPVLVAAGMLTRADGPTFASYCRAYARWVAAERALDLYVEANPEFGGLMVRRGSSFVLNPLVTNQRAAMADHLRHAIELGLTPSARVKLTVDPHRGNATKGFLG